jgi:hypothetical protein
VRPGAPSAGTSERSAEAISMTTRYLLGLFDSIYVLCLAAMAGGIVFFTFVVAPVIFRVLGPEAGGRFVRALFPRYYLWNAILGSIALPAFVAGPLCFPEYRGIAVGIQAGLLLGCILSMLYGGNSLVRQINQARDEGASSHARFERLHRRSVVLNAAVMVAAIGLLVAFACRPGPRTEGIVELSPIERVRREEDQLREQTGRPADFGRGPAKPAATPQAGGP